MMESEELELKRSTSNLKKAIISISAMLNKHGVCEVYFGISNDGTIIGQDVTEKTLRSVSQAISNHIEPKIFPVIKKRSFDSKDCVYVRASGENKPYYAYGRVYLRVGDEDRLSTPKKIEKLIIQKNRDKNYWDNFPSDISEDDINEKELIDFVRRGKEAGRLEFDYRSKSVTLNKLGLLKDEKLLRIAD